MKEDFLLSDEEISVANRIPPEEYGGKPHWWHRVSKKVAQAQLSKLPDIWGILDKVKEKCIDCNGEGLVLIGADDGTTCPDCKGKGYTYDLDRLVALSKDQRLPYNPYLNMSDLPQPLSRSYQKEGYYNAQQDMLNNNWRKVELEEKC